MYHYDSDLNKLAKASIKELSNFRGIGDTKAISIIAALETGRRRDDTENKPLETIIEQPG
jgi:DNA repair protein RadC